MDNFIVSARKYRPNTFKTVVGQPSITTTLKNAISKKHLAHAYLFFGPRGVGKTTCARIFAKTINCQNITSDFEACNTCESCQSFNESRSYNIHELDAASNNSVDEMRNLTDQVRIPPQLGKYSIYIIDEVHMLSSSAFNAFLKTLEEPPAHAIFILATTEKHKIIPTILSRCQIFDFNRIEIKDIVEHLHYIAEKENVKADKNGLNVIAQKADGAMRDALSIFDQIVSFSGNEITYENVIENLNVLDYEYYFKFVDAFYKTDYSSALMLFNDILNKGFDGQNFITGLSKHLRDLLVCNDLVTIKLLEVGEDIQQKYKEQATRCEVDFLLSALELTNKFDLNYKSSNNKRLHIEIALMQLSSLLKKKANQEYSEKVISKQPIVIDPVIKTEVKNKQEQIEVSKNEVKPPLKNVESSKNEIQSSVVDTKLVKEKSTVSENIVKPLIDKPIETLDNTVKQEVISSQKKDDYVDPKPKKAKKDVIPSISEALSGYTESKSKQIIEEPEVVFDKNETNPIIESDLKKVWKELSEKFKTEQPRVAVTLEENYPLLKEGNVLHLKVLNASQRNSIKEIRPIAIPFLREKLNTNFVTFEIEVEEIAKSTTTTPYTQEEKIKYISEKYPVFGKFKEQLKLDYD